jgi:hypothetical protein
MMGEARIALLMLGLDAMDPVRPQVDQLDLDVLHSHIFATTDLFETRQGICRLMPPLTHRLVELAPTLTRWMAPVVESVAKVLLAEGGTMRRRVRTCPRSCPGEPECREGRCPAPTEAA